MCGIIGIAAKPGVLGDPLGRVIRKCLKNLEYRGYDSVGYVVLGSEMILAKAAGELDKVADRLGFDEADGVVGIGHTRWATHGSPNDVNAHPHVDCSGRIAVVHNGIIKNYRDLREALSSAGHRFVSETDTEVIPHMIEEAKRRGMSTLQALRKTFKALEGAFAIALVDSDEPDKVFFARNVSPLIVGLGNGVNFVASDIPAFLEYTNIVITVRDGEYGYITSGDVYIADVEGGPVNVKARVRVVNWTPSMAKKGGYPHFMLKEIHEQPVALKTTIEGMDEAVDAAADLITSSRRVFIGAAGTSYHASLVGGYVLMDLAGIAPHVFISSEYRAVSKASGEGDVAIIVSQSGETIDSYVALKEFRRRGVKVIAVSNVVDSMIPRNSDVAVYTRAGPEIGVAATKTFTTQVAVLTEIGLRAALKLGSLGRGEYRDLHGWLERTPDLVQDVIRRHEGYMKDLGRRLASKNNAYYLGRGIGVPVSMEGALKLKEIAYIHAEAYPAGESKHGPIALIEEGFPTIFTVMEDGNEEALHGNVMEMRSRGALTIGLVPEGDEMFSGILSHTIAMPRMPYTVAPIVYIVPLQMLAYYASISRGYNPDKPRNLAKTVTVE